MGVTEIKKYINTGVYPRYYLPGYNPKRGYSREVYDKAKTLFYSLDYTSESFWKSVLPVVRVLQFPIDSTASHPMYFEIIRKSTEIRELCKNIFPDMHGVWYLERGGQMTTKERTILREKGYSGDTLKTYALSCNDTRVAFVCPAYSEGKVDHKKYPELVKASADLINLVIKASWLPMYSWLTIQIPNDWDDMRVVTVRGRAMSDFYFCEETFSKSLNEYANYEATHNRMNRQVRETNVTRPVHLNETSSSAELLAAVRNRRIKVDNIKAAGLPYKLNPKDILDSVVEASPILNIGSTRYAAKAQGHKKMGMWASTEMYNDALVASKDFANARFWTNIPEYIKVNVFPVDSEEAHPDYAYLKPLCEKIEDLLINSCEPSKIGKFWYLQKTVAYDPTDKQYESYEPQDCTKYTLYCCSWNFGFIRPCFCYDNKRHSELEVRLAELVYSLTSAPWLQDNLWSALALPCSGIIKKNFGGNPVFLGEDALSHIRLASNRVNI